MKFCYSITSKFNSSKVNLNSTNRLHRWQHFIFGFLNNSHENSQVIIEESRKYANINSTHSRDFVCACVHALATLTWLTLIELCRCCKLSTWLLPHTSQKRSQSSTCYAANLVIGRLRLQQQTPTSAYVRDSRAARQSMSQSAGRQTKVN